LTSGSFTTLEEICSAIALDLCILFGGLTEGVAIVGVLPRASKSNIILPDASTNKRDQYEDKQTALIEPGLGYYLSYLVSILYKAQFIAVL